MVKERDTEKTGERFTLRRPSTSYNEFYEFYDVNTTQRRRGLHGFRRGTTSSNGPLFEES
jgi:hypothetical protein